MNKKKLFFSGRLILNCSSVREGREGERGKVSLRVQVWRGSKYKEAKHIVLGGKVRYKSGHTKEAKHIATVLGRFGAPSWVGVQTTTIFWGRCKSQFFGDMAYKTFLGGNGIKYKQETVLMLKGMQYMYCTVSSLVFNSSVYIYIYIYIYIISTR